MSRGILEFPGGAADLTWPTLTRPSGDASNGRRRGPYTEALLRQAITRGVDPANNALHVTMPRYRLTRDDSADLIAYLRRLGPERDPSSPETR